MSILRLSVTAFTIAATIFAIDARAQTNQIGRNPKTTQQVQPTQNNYPSQQSQTGQYDQQNDQQGPVTLSEAIIKKLIHSNKAEVELAQIAQEKASSEEVRQLAQTMIQDHQQMINKLEQRKSQTGLVSGNTNASGSGQAGTASASGTNATNRADSTGLDSSITLVPQQLCELTKVAGENALAMCKEMLSKQEGQDFDMAFLGQQCVMHTMAIAELKAIEQVGPNDLQEVASSALPKVKGHLEQAKKLAKKLEDDRQASSGSSKQR